MSFDRSFRLVAVCALAFPLTTHAQRGGGGPRAEPANPIQEGLPLKPERTIRFTTDVGSWMSLDLSPDGQTIVFDHLGDIFTIPVTGGKATPITKGMAVDAQPRFSPDGKRIAFISDRRGAPNLWHISLDLADTVQVTTGRTDSYDSPEWTPDGKYIVVTRGNNLHMYHVDGGAGVQLGAPPATAAATGRGGGAPATGRYLGAAFGKDPRYIWAARRTASGQWTYNDPMGGGYSLVVYDRNTGEFSPRGTRWGAAFRPTLSPDGKWLVYGTRYDQQTGLRIRDLETDQERWLAYPVQRDDQESRASRDVYPGMSFTPDSKSLIVTWSGKIWSVPVAGGAPRQIPFTVDVEQHLGPEVKFDYPLSDSATFTVRQIRNATPSPDGKRLAFTALDKLYTMELPNGAPKRVSDAPGLEFQPTWSPDGQWLAYTSWTEAEMGHLWKARVAGGRPVRLTQSPGAYQQPVFTPDGQRVVAIRGSAPAFAEETQRGGTDLVWVSANGGPVTLIAPTAGASNPHFVKGSNDRIYASSGARGLFSMRWDGTDIQEHVRISVPSPSGGGGGGGSNASWIRMAPEGDQALAVVGNDLYVATVPLVGGTTPTVNCGSTPNFPCRRLTEIGGAFPAWSWDSKKVHYSMGNAHAIYDLERAKVVDDSVRLANRNRPQRDSAAARDSTGPPRPPVRPVEPEDSARANAPAPQTRAANAYKPVEFRIIVKANRDIPQSSAVLRGARVVTMRGDEVIENADIVIRNNRIAAVGARGSVQVPQGAEVIDVTGKTITPGFVDTHAHLRVPQPIHRGEVWSFAANLAYGVTTTRDPQTGSTDIFTYEDMIESGDILGPRALSTGPGVFSGENFRNLEHARQVLKRYSDYYGTGTIKQYVAGNREQRQWVIQAAREQRLMPTTEGSLDLEMNLTEAIDGYSGHEHSWPSFPFQSDLITFFAKSGIVYTPTVLVAYGGPWSENYWYENTNVHGDPKVRRFLPHAEIDNKTLRRGSGGQAGWFHEDEHIMKYISEQVGDLVAAGGKAGVGSHGQFQGLGWHWELWSMAWDKSKVPPHMGLLMATQMGADAIGRGKDIGSIEVGKLADLVVLDRNPLEDIRNTNSVRYVMKNGRLYDGNTLDEVYPRKRPAKFYWQAGDNPADAPAGGGSGAGPGRPGTPAAAPRR